MIKKSDIDELPPPPPPFPTLKLEDVKQADSSSKQADMPQDLEFSELVRSLESEPVSAKAEKIKPVPKAKKLAIKGQKKQIKGKLEIDGIDLESLNPDKTAVRQKPKEVLEAQDEIKSAIEKIKIRERPSILKRIFPGKPAEANKDENLFPLVKETGDLDIVRNKISMAKRAIMNLKLDEARKEYDEMIVLYNSMKPREQAEVYEGIKEIYLERKNAESLKLAA